MDDDQLRRIVSAEYDRREEEKQRQCRHATSGTQVAGGVTCDACGKLLGAEDKANRFTGIGEGVSQLESRSIR